MIGDSANVKALPVVQAAEFLQWLHDGEPFEVCIIGSAKSTSTLWEGRANGNSTIAGWFTDAERAAELACQVEAKGVYVTLNPVNDALLSRAESRFKAGVNRTADKSIARIRNLLIDLDPIREEGVSSTDMEHRAALDMAKTVKANLSIEGWPEPLYGDSGNGAHLIYPVDLPNTPESVALVKAVLLALASRYADQLTRLNLEIDQIVFNPGRLTKLFGTWARKGDNTKTRPHRLSQVIHEPERRPVSVELLKKVAATIPTEEKPKATPPDGDARVDVQAYLTDYGREVVKVKPHGDGQLYCLAACIFDSSHIGNEAAIGQAADGKLFYQCFHKSCKGRTWTEARQIISGDAKLTPFMVGWRTPKAFTKKLLRTPLLEGLLAKVQTALKSGDLTDDEIAHVLNLIIKPESGKPIAQEVREWVLLTSGNFFLTEVNAELGFITKANKQAAFMAIQRLEKEGLVKKCGEKRGCYRRVEREAQELDFLSADTGSPSPIKWPFELEKLVNIYPKNLIIVAGSKDAGKTAFMLNVVRLNMERFKVNYYSSEMGEQELALRLLGFGYPLNSWKFKAYERASNFADIIEPDALNIIDFLEISDNFYLIAGELRKIYEKLRNGLAVIAIQKDDKAELGRGKAFSLEKARMYLALDSGKDCNELKVVSGKNWAQRGHNPKGKIIKFKLVDGCRFMAA